MCRIGNLRSALVPKLFHQLFELFANDLLQAIGVPEDVEVVGDLSNFVGVLLQQLLMLQAGEPVQAQIQNGLGLSRRQVILLLANAELLR